MHKLIYKFQDELDNLVHDFKQRQLRKAHKGMNVEVNGEATVSQIFTITESSKTKKGLPKKHLQVAGCVVHHGALTKSMKFRLLRQDQVIYDDLKAHSLKRFKNEVESVDKGLDCGLSLEGLPATFKLEQGDTIECYREVEAEPDRFDYKPGLKSSY